MTGLWPLAVYAGAAVLLVVAMIALSSVLGQRHRERATAEPYESGVASTGSARLRFDIAFYLIAMFFVIFDVESAFIFAWAISARDLGWPGYLAVVFFIGVMAVMLVYLWRMGALDWASGPARSRRRA